MPGKIRKKTRGNLDLYEALMTFEPDTLSIASDASRSCLPGTRLSEEASRQGIQAFDEQRSTARTRDARMFTR
jgi:hypothetical protein